MEIQHIQEAADRIRKAIQDKERVILYGDSDLDGVCSVLILKEAIQSQGGEPAALYFPDREAEGYGLTEMALERLQSHTPALLVIMDMGITSVAEVEKANELGFEVIIIDHHEVVGGKLPQASVIVNPKQPGDTYPFKTLAACGLTFRVAERLAPDMSPSLRRVLVELAALGTIADMMPREADNWEIIQEGLESMPSSWRPGLKVFWESPHLRDFSSFEEKIYQAISVLNVRDIEKGLPGAYRQLSSKTKEDADELMEYLWQKNQARQEAIRAIVDEVEHRLRGKAPSSLVFEGFEDVEYVYLGSAASTLAKNWNKPVFLYKDKGEEALGSARSPSGYDTVKAMESCSDLLIAFGGHPPASGFRLKTENVEKFHERLSDYFKKHSV